MDIPLQQIGIGVGSFSVSLGFALPLIYGYILPAIVRKFTRLDRQSDFLFTQSKNNLPKTSDYDFIIIGAGSAGSVVANRLSEKFNVLLIERGGEQNPITAIPIIAISQLNNPDLDYGYRTVPQKSACLAFNNQQSSWSRGIGLGGTSNLNWMIYYRGHTLDYDNWANITGDQGWNYNNVLPFFKISEDYCLKCEPKIHDSTFNPYYHHRNGYLTVEKISSQPLVEEFLQASEWSGIPRTDLNAPYREGCGPIVLTSRNGRRCSTNTAFLDPIRNRKTLTIHKYARAYNILFRGENNEAYGVEYEHHGIKTIAYAKMEIVISTGVIETPKLLMLSGIGPKNHLESLGIKVVRDAPGVGRNLQDHLGTFAGPFLINETKSFLLERDITFESINEFIEYDRGYWTSTAVHANSFHISSQSENESPDIQFMFVGAGVYNSIDETFAKSLNLRADILKPFYDPVKGRDGFLIFVYNLQPKSVGQILLQSRDYKDDPIINPKYLADAGQHDIKVLIEGVKRAVNISENAPSFAKLGSHLSPVHFPPCKLFEFRSDEYWECFIRYFSMTEYHFTGTAAMGKRSTPTAVVDSELRVIGTERLRVVDSSIMPKIVTVNTNAPTIMIGEKGAQLILDSWKNSTKTKNNK